MGGRRFRPELAPPAALWGTIARAPQASAAGVAWRRSRVRVDCPAARSLGCLFAARRGRAPRFPAGIGRFVGGSKSAVLCHPFIIQSCVPSLPASRRRARRTDHYRHSDARRSGGRQCLLACHAGETVRPEVLAERWGFGKVPLGGMHREFMKAMAHEFANRSFLNGREAE